MATPRKHWFRVADSVTHEPWSNDVMATFVRLLGHLNTRWAREGRSAGQAGEVLLSRGTSMQLTGSGSLARARSILRELATHVSLTIDEQGTNTLVSWPKFAKFQRLESESGAALEPDASQLVPPPQDAPAPAPARQEEIPLLFPLEAPAADASAQAPPPSDKASRKLRASKAPDRLPEEAIQALEQWTREHLPSELPNVRAHIDACLDHFRANGKLMADWAATCRNWIRRAPEMRRAPVRGAPPAPAIQRKHTEEEIEAAARQWREQTAERRARAMRP